MASGAAEQCHRVYQTRCRWVLIPAVNAVDLPCITGTDHRDRLSSLHYAENGYFCAILAAFQTMVRSAGPQ